MSAPDLENVQKEIRAEIDKYWNAWLDGDIDKFLSFINEKFVGWSSSMIPTITKADTQEFMKAAGELMGITLGNVTINPINEHLGMAFYFWSRTQRLEKDGALQELPYCGRTTHLWIKEAGRWTIVGGMDAPSGV